MGRLEALESLQNSLVREKQDRPRLSKQVEEGFKTLLALANLLEETKLTKLADKDKQHISALASYMKSNIRIKNLSRAITLINIKTGRLNKKAERLLERDAKRAKAQANPLDVVSVTSAEAKEIPVTVKKKRTLEAAHA